MVRILTRGSLLLTATVTVLLLPASARGVDDFFVADVSQVGAVRLVYYAPANTHVEFYERIGSRLKPLGASTGTEQVPPQLLEAVRWRCDRLVRRFEATIIDPDGTRHQDSYDVRTPSCANRLRLSAPRRAALGATGRVRVEDRWKNGGIKPRLCITPPRARRACRVLAFPDAVNFAGRHFRATKRGLWRVELRLNGHRTRAAVRVGGGSLASRATPPTLLATGDSTMQGIDSYIGDRLGETATVRSDVRPATSISKDLVWLARATAQTKRYRPSTTVISLGGLEGHPMQALDGGTRECCDALWVEEYTRRVRVMMKTYLRRGHGRVLWLTIPAPRDPDVAAVVGIVNGAIVRAAEGLAGARILRLDALFTPAGYREYMPYRGKTVRVRSTDGGHLTAAGAAIAARAIEKALR